MDAREGWEIVEDLQIPAEVIMRTAIEDGWLTDDTAKELLEFADITRSDDE